MASQQILFAETIAGMKKAFKRKAYESDSDSEIEKYSNRGNKLKKRGRFAHKGQLVPTNGPSAYKENVEYGGVERAIIHRNPPLVDDEGYEVDSDDDDDRLHDAELAAAELNPYSNIHIQHILAPLTSSTALPTHATLSKPFTSKTLTRLVDQSCDITRKENHSLWQVRHLLTALCGDFTWVPCKMMVKPTDIELYTDDHVARHLLSLSKGLTAINGGTPSPATLDGDVPQQSTSNDANKEEGSSKEKPETEDADVSMADVDAPEKTSSEQDKKVEGELDKDGDDVRSKEKQTAGGKETSTNADLEGNARDEPLPGDQPEETAKEINDKMTDAGNAAGTALAGVSGGVLDLIDKTDGQASSLASDILDQTFVHPMFIAPVGAKPDRDVGIPEQEAEDIRRLLALYVQKQEEVCRGAKKLYLGLLKAEKLRHDVLHWSKAEAHSGANRDMSDGEDWYDKEEWGLTEDLKKGQDEEEEDTQTTGKKTRNRR